MPKDFDSARIAVVGAGAIGGISAAFMAAAGVDLTLVCKHAELAELVRGQGLAIFGVRGRHQVKLPAVAAIGDLAAPLDLVLLATRADQTAAAAQELLPLLHPKSLVVSMQNGICEEILAEMLGPQLVVGCVVAWAGTHHGPGELEMTSLGEFVLGAWQGEDDRLPALAEMMSAVVPVRLTGNIGGELFAKLIVNACMNPLGALTGLNLGQLLATKKARAIFLAVMREALAVAAAQGLEVPPGGGGKLDFYRFLAGKGRLADFKRHLTIRIIGHRYRRSVPSTLQSLRRGRPTEIDFLNGYLVAQGEKLGVATPVNECLVRLVKEIEAGARTISPDNLEDPALGDL